MLRRTLAAIAQRRRHGPAVFGRLLPAYLAAAALLAGPAAAGEADAARAEQARARLQEVRERIEAVKERIDATRQRHDRLRRRLEEVDEAIGQASAELRELEDKIATRDARLGELRERQRRKRRDLADDRRQLARQIRAAHRTGRRGRLKMLLNQEDPAAVGRALVYYDYLNEARTEAIRELTARLTELHELEQAVRAEKRELERLRGRKRETLVALRDKHEERRAVLERLAKQLEDRSRKLDQLRADKQRLQNLVADLQDTLSDIPPDLGSGPSFADQRGELRSPVDGRVVEARGQARRRTHSDGVVIAARGGSEVRAIHRGRVAFADWLPHYGLLIIIEHGGGYLSLYGHNRTLLKQVGTWVEAGEPIATVGRSGGQRRTALYFEVRHNKKPLDPRRWCQLRVAAR